ncbi:MAG: sigma-54 dependent transcriptional regulator [bacterium]|nr:sigma-54 dependent transcriptional regulator [bacterium]
MTKYHLLVVDDDVNRCKMLEYKLKKADYKVTYSTSPKTALEIFNRENIDLVISDIRMGEMTGIELLRELKKIDPLVIVILITAYGKDAELLLNALRSDAFDFLEKVEDIDLLSSIIERGIKSREEKIGFAYLKNIQTAKSESEFIGENKKIRDILKVVKNVAPTDSTALITGESGTGKEIIAKMIHNLSKRRDNNFISFNCAAINANLIESELFGYKKGAFTGAYTNKDGLFKVADKGTIFLDEIAEMDTNMQAKLLRVIQEREITPIGSTESIPVDVRIISATNKNIEEEVKNNKFRLDLFYRLNVIRIDIPPLRERKEDIQQIFNYYVDKYSARYSRKISKINADVYGKLERYKWPGNVRELMNVIERIMVIKNDNEIKADDLSMIDLSSGGDKECDMKIDTLENMEKVMIKRVLKKRENDKKAAAKDLGINLSTLYRKIAQYRIED